MERNDVFKAIRAGSLATAPYIGFFVCPSSPPATMTGPTLAYAGNCGSAISTGSNRFDGIMVDTFPISNATSHRVMLDAVSEADGTATTLALSERCNTGTVGLQQASWSTGPPSNPNPFFENTGSAIPGFGIVNTAPPATIRPINSQRIGDNTNLGQVNSPSSNHPGGVVAAFADGHTVYLKDSLNSAVYAQLLSWNSDLASPTSRTTWSGTAPLNEGFLQ
jgi:prepilin-type processing-associated H-X9-DG protein